MPDPIRHDNGISFGVRMLQTGKTRRPLGAAIALLALFEAPFIIGCTERRPELLGRRTMPAPTGCYALIADESDLNGSREYINGPARHATLTELPFAANWHERIRSIELGPTATATVWTGERFGGSAMMLEANLRYPKLSPAFDRKVRSLEVSCVPE